MITEDAQGPDGRRPSSEEFREVLDLIDRNVDAITDADVDAYLDDALSTAGFDVPDVQPSVMAPRLRPAEPAGLESSDLDGSGLADTPSPAPPDAVDHSRQTPRTCGLEVVGIRHLRGPNIFLSRPVVVAGLRLAELAGRESSDVDGFNRRLLEALPGLAEHHCSAGAPGGFVSRLRGGTYFGHVTEHVYIELSNAIGREVAFGRTVSTGEPGSYDLILECPVDEPAHSALPGALLSAAVELVSNLVTCSPHEPELTALRSLAEREAIDPGTRLIIDAARRRGIPVERLRDPRLVRLGWGSRRQLTIGTVSDRTGAAGFAIASSQEATRELLSAAGIPTVDSRTGSRYRVFVVAGEVVAAERIDAPTLDVTDLVHPDIARLCQRVAALIGLDVAAVDLATPDIAEPMPATAAGVCGVDATPAPQATARRSAQVGDAIVRAMFPEGADGRIPAIAVAGTNGKTTVARLTAHLLSGDGLAVGLAGGEAVTLDGRPVRTADVIGPGHFQSLLSEPGTQAAVVEADLCGIAREGLGYDWSDVGVITNITAEHLGQYGFDTVEDIAHATALIAERVRDDGTLILNADDPWVRSLADRPRVRADRKRIVWFSQDPGNPCVAEHLARGHTAYLQIEGRLTRATGASRAPLLDIRDVPGAYGGAAPHAVSNALAAMAAARALGVPDQVAADRLRIFDPTRQNPGRGTLLMLNDVSVLVDRGRNPAALAATLRILHRLYGPDRCLTVAALPGDRRDDLIAASAQVIADAVGRAVLYDYQDPRGREPGEVAALIEREMKARRPSLTVTRTAGYQEALATGLGQARPGDVILVMYEHLTQAMTALADLGATPVEIGPLPRLGGAHQGSQAPRSTREAMTVTRRNQVSIGDGW